MKILQVVHSFPPHNMAGTEIYTDSLCRELSSKGHDSSIFHRVSNLRAREYELEHNRHNGLDIFTINNTFRACDSFEGFYKNDDITGAFCRVLDEIKPDIVHIQHLIFLSTTIIAEVKKRHIPIVFTLHDYWLICPQWHFLKKDLSICNNNDISECLNCLDYQLSIKKLPKRIYLFLRDIIPDFLMRFLKRTYISLSFPRKQESTGIWIPARLSALASRRSRGKPRAYAGMTIFGQPYSNRALEKIRARTRHIKEICQMVDVFIAPSQFIKARFIEFGIPEDKIRFIPHGIDTESLKGFIRTASNKIRFSFIGTILPAKGVDILIKAFNMIQDDNAELKIYGKLFPYNGFEYYPRYIQRLAKNGNIRFMSSFEHNDISHVFSEVDVLVFPSIWNENYPLTILEAFSTKTPVIASRIGGIPELVKDKENGLLFESGNIDGLYSNMRVFIDNPGIIEKFRNSNSLPKSIVDNVRELEDIYSYF